MQWKCNRSHPVFWHSVGKTLAGNWCTQGLTFYHDKQEPTIPNQTTFDLLYGSMLEKKTYTPRRSLKNLATSKKLMVWKAFGRRLNSDLNLNEKHATLQQKLQPTSSLLFSLKQQRFGPMTSSHQQAETKAEKCFLCSFAFWNQDLGCFQINCLLCCSKIPPQMVETRTWPLVTSHWYDHSFPSTPWMCVCVCRGGRSPQGLGSNNGPMTEWPSRNSMRNLKKWR